jgi:ABC-type transport system involved in multi-copper enzyme maturation permease subunit|tara:strand:+ start:48 stop:470 length:423 start_codon:yes stop_codon:yes gene_type:complete
MNLQKILTIGIAVIFVIAVALMIMINNGGEDSSAIDMMLWFGEILVFGAGAIAIVLSLKNIASNPAKVKIAGIALLGLLVIIGISYGLSSGQEVLNDTGEQMVSESGSKLVGTGLRVFYILIIVALGAMVASGVKKALNK